MMSGITLEARRLKISLSGLPKFSSKVSHPKLNWEVQPVLSAKQVEQEQDETRIYYKCPLPVLLFL